MLRAALCGRDCAASDVPCDETQLGPQTGERGAQEALSTRAAAWRAIASSSLVGTTATVTGDASREITRAPEDREGERFVSPVGFGRLSYQAVEAGWVETFALLISINVFVGIFNLVPLLPFDGGHIAIATYEKVASTIRRRRVQVDVQKLMPITAAVVAVLGFIFLSSLFMDLNNPVDNPF